MVQSNLQSVLNEAYFEIVCEEYGVEDPEALKKSIEARRFGEEQEKARTE